MDNSFLQRVAYFLGDFHHSKNFNEKLGMERRREKHRDAGFTLIELMIVVGIIGVLVAVAAPNFSRYQSKSRQSEAKIALSTIYGLEKSFYSEYSSYAGSMNAIGYTPEGQRRFYLVGWVSSHATTITGYQDGDLTLANYTAVNNTFTCSNAESIPAGLSGDTQTFLVGASGCIREGAPGFDNWNIDEQKVLNNNQINL